MLILACVRLCERLLPHGIFADIYYLLLDYENEVIQHESLI